MATAARRRRQPKPTVPRRALLHEKVSRAALAHADAAPSSLVSHALLCHQTDAGDRMVPALHHQEWVQVLEDRETFPWVVVVAPPGYAKALADDTPMLTTNGWKRHGDVEAGDQVFAPDGRAVPVVATKRWEPLRPCSRVIFSDGTEILADDLHDWDVLCDRERHRPVGQRRGPRSAVRYVPGTRPHRRVEERLETRMLLEGQRRPPAIPVAAPLTLPDRPLPIDPYVLGAWLGDGTSASGAITVGHQDIDHFAPLGSVVDYPSSSGLLVRVKGLTTALRQAALLNAKHVPGEYLLASDRQRLALLQGLMDTDGTISPAGQAFYCTTSSLLAHQVRSLVCSLGMKASILVGDARVDGRSVGDAYRVSFHPHRPVFRLPRKAARVRAETTERARRRYVTDVVPAGRHPAKCISVQGGRYLAGEALVPTHNSTWFSEVYPSWRIGATGGRVRVGLVSNTHKLARGHAKVVQDTITSRWFQLAYPDVVPDLRRGWRTDEFFVTGAPPGKNPTLAAAGVTGPIIGARFDEIILDDPTKFEESRSDAIMERQRNWVRNTLLKRFPAGQGPPHGTGGRMVVVTTRWSERDLVPMLTDDLGFKLVRMPALGYWDRAATCPRCEKPRRVDLYSLLQRCEHCDSPAPPDVRFGDAPLWPEAESRELLHRELHDDELIFRLVKQGDASALSGDLFERKWFQRGMEPYDMDRVVVSIDTSGGRDRKRGDFTAIVVIGRKGNRVWVLDVKRGRWPAPEQRRQFLRACWEWSPETAAIEGKNEGVALYQNLVADGSNLPLKLVDVVDDKEFRAIPMANAYRAGYVYHADRTKQGLPNQWVTAFESEMESFPGGAHNDQVDAATMGFNELDKTGPRVRVLR